MFVGLGAARVRDLFDQARKSAPCIIFIDELDALGRARTLGYLGSGASDEKEQTLNQLLAELDGFDSSVGIILLGATNRPEILDPALLRAGRFDRQIMIDRPDRNGRAQILKIHSRKVKLEASVDTDRIAALTPGFSGADLANLVNEAALVATRRDAPAVTETDFTKAIERIVAGLERKKRLILPEEKRRVAYHEMGHATVSLALNTLDRVHKISIIPRGIGSLGHTMQRPDEERYLITKPELLDKLTVLLGGRASEILFCKEISTGAGDDLARATDIARAMVTQYGMSERLGLSVYERNESPFLQGPMMPPLRNVSDHTGEVIEEEIRRILAEREGEAEKALNRCRDFVEEGVRRLLDTETLESTEIQELWAKYGKEVS
jgi:cell division protease FtsH